MAKRKTFFKVDSSSVMGDGSYVKISPITKGEARQIKNDAERLAADLGKAQEEVTRARSANASDVEDKEQRIEELTKELEALDNKIFVDFILEWDWVDEDDNPLPLPKSDVTVLERLYAHETTFLTEAIYGTVNQKK